MGVVELVAAAVAQPEAPAADLVPADREDGAVRHGEQRGAERREQVLAVVPAAHHGRPWAPEGVAERDRARRPGTRTRRRTRAGERPPARRARGWPERRAPTCPAPSAIPPGGAGHRRRARAVAAAAAAGPRVRARARRRLRHRVGRADHDLGSRRRARVCDVHADRSPVTAACARRGAPVGLGRPAEDVEHAPVAERDLTARVKPRPAARARRGPSRSSWRRPPTRSRSPPRRSHERRPTPP